MWGKLMLKLPGMNKREKKLEHLAKKNTGRKKISGEGRKRPGDTNEIKKKAGRIRTQRPSEWSGDERE